MSLTLNSWVVGDRRSSACAPRRLKRGLWLVSSVPSRKSLNRSHVNVGLKVSFSTCASHCLAGDVMRTQQDAIPPPGSEVKHLPSQMSSDTDDPINRFQNRAHVSSWEKPPCSLRVHVPTFSVLIALSFLHSMYLAIMLFLVPTPIPKITGLANHTLQEYDLCHYTLKLLHCWADL